MNLELLVNSSDVRAHRVESDPETVGDFLDQKSLGKPAQNLLLTRRKVCRLAGWRGTTKRLDDLARDLAAHGCAARMHVANGFQQFRRRRSFEQITRGSGGKRLENLFRILIDREHDDVGGERLRLELPDTLHATHAGKVDVHEHDIRLHRRQLVQRFLRARVTAEAAEIPRASQDANQRVPDARIIFHDRYRDAHSMSFNSVCFQQLQLNAVVQFCADAARTPVVQMSDPQSRRLRTH